MKALMSKKAGSRMVISGVILAFVGFVALMLNVFNVYGKASTNCISRSNCNVSNNLLISRIGIVAFFVGLVVIAFGIVLLVVSSSRRK